MLETRDDRHFRVVRRLPVIGSWRDGGNLAATSICRVTP